VVSAAIPGHEFFQLATLGHGTQQILNVGEAQHRVTPEMIINELNRLLHRFHRRQVSKSSPQPQDHRQREDERFKAGQERQVEVGRPAKLQRIQFDHIIPFQRLIHFRQHPAALFYLLEAGFRKKFVDAKARDHGP